ncbi:MAG: ChbG/HpnK family deacetylase [Clostridia bacterium]|nr:ChbG/HpnK family deacetylase [Clostridia bacterium]
MKLIINADDFGLSKSISNGIIEGINDGFITSTSIMANMECAEYAIKQAIEHNVNCIGLHINLTVGKPVLKNCNLVDEKGVFLYNKKQIENTKLTYEDAYNEIKAQINLINKYSNGIIKIDHIDTHHHLCENENIKNAIIDIAKEYNIPIRNEFDCDVLKPDILYKNFTIKNVSINSLDEMISKYQKKDIVIELMTHPGYIDNYTRTVTSYLDRNHELKVLKMAKEKKIFDKVVLINFQQL